MANKIALCPRDKTPLVGTFVFNGFEFYCMECAGRFGMFDIPTVEATPELVAQKESLTAEFAEHADGIITHGAKLGDCRMCEKGEAHHLHLTLEDRRAHRDAINWLRERAGLEPEPEAEVTVDQ